MLTVKVYTNYNPIALQVLDTDDLEGCEFSSKFRAESIGDIKKLMACVWHSENHPNYSNIHSLGLYKAL